MVADNSNNDEQIFAEQNFVGFAATAAPWLSGLLLRDHTRKSCARREGEFHSRFSFSRTRTVLYCAVRTEWLFLKTLAIQYREVGPAGGIDRN